MNNEIILGIRRVFNDDSHNFKKKLVQPYQNIQISATHSKRDALVRSHPLPASVHLLSTLGAISPLENIEADRRNTVAECIPLAVINTPSRFRAQNTTHIPTLYAISFHLAFTPRCHSIPQLIAGVSGRNRSTCFVGSHFANGSGCSRRKERGISPTSITRRIMN